MQRVINPLCVKHLGVVNRKNMCSFYSKFQ